MIAVIGAVLLAIIGIAGYALVGYTGMVLVLTAVYFMVLKGEKLL